MISGAIDESALLHVHISYLTRYSADEFSALIGFPLFLVASLYRLSRFPLRPLSTLIILILDLLSSFLSRTLHRSRSYCSHRRRRCRCLFLSSGNATALTFRETGRHFHLWPGAQ